MESRFTSEFFVGNRQRLKELFTGTAPIVVAANGILQKGGDNTYPFAQDANFWYLTGIDEPDLILVMDRDKEYLIVPERSDSRQAFDGSVDYSDLTKVSGIKNVCPAKEGWNQLESRVQKVKHLATIAVPPAYVDHYGLYTNPARAKLVQKLKEQNSELELLDLTPHLSRMRMIKQAPELSAIKKAIEITADSIKVASNQAIKGKHEFDYELEAQISFGFRKRGAAGHAFEPIVAAGKRACVLHNFANNSPLNNGELIVIDVGAEVEHYAADITRTISYGSPSRRQIAVHQAVLDVQKFAFGLLKPGVILKDYELEVEHYMGEKLRELGLLKTITHDKIRHYYPHAASHFLGLNVHDVGEYDRPLEAGTVLTVEPGIYIPEEAIGIRIEDDVSITPIGIEILSDRLSRELI